MGIMLCPIHGRQSFYEVCGHIMEDLKKEIVPKMKDTPIIGPKLCDACYNQGSNFKELEGLTLLDTLERPEKEIAEIDERIFANYDKINRTAICLECFKNIQIIDARKKNLALPFEPFENTLMHKDNAVIDQLRTILKSNFQFQKFRNPYTKTLDAFIIKSGGISYPFSISFYYVIKKDDQRKLLKLIDDFFLETPLKQRKISFYEAENWIETKNGGQYKGEEKVILEKIVK